MSFRQSSGFVDNQQSVYIVFQFLWKRDSLGIIYVQQVINRQIDILWSTPTISKSKVPNVCFEIMIVKR